MKRPVASPIIVPLGVLLAAMVSGLVASWMCNEAMHRRMQTEMRAVFQHPLEHMWTTMATGCAPFEVIAPWTSSINDRPRHPPPVVRGGWFFPDSWIFAAKLSGPLLLLHLALTWAVCWLYQRSGHPKRIAPGLNELGDVWYAIIAPSAWAGALWPSLAIFIWVGWYWFLLAPMPVVYAQAHVEPLGVLGILFGAFLGHMLTIAYFVRRNLRSKATPATECLRCEYSLEGIGLSACPECGREQLAHARPAFGLSRTTFRASISWKRWILRGVQIAAVLYFLAFPRTLLLSASPLGDHRFQQFVYSVGDPCALWIMRHIGLGGDGSDSEDVIGNSK